MRGRVAAFVKLGRPLFLLGGVSAYGLGVAAAASVTHTVKWPHALAGQLVVSSFQLMTHYANDHFDYEADRLNTTPTRWSGGSRVLPDELLPRGVALWAALACAALGLVASAFVGAVAQAPLLTLGVCAAMGALSWAYSAPPRPLHSTGLGELDAALVVAGLVPMLGFVLQTPSVPVWFLCALLPPLALQFAMVVAVAFPDAVADAHAGKHTLVVRLGPRASAWVYAGAVVCAHASAFVMWMAGVPVLVTWAIALLSPLSAWRAARAIAGDTARRDRFESVTFWAVASLTVVTVGELVAFAIVAASAARA